MINMKTLLAALLVGLAVAGCGKEAPACADVATTDLFKAVIKDASEQQISILMRSQAALMPLVEVRKLSADFFTRMTVGLSNIVTDGYDSAAKRRSCQASVTFTLPNIPQPITQTVVYATQLTEGSKSAFVLAIEGGESIGAAIAKAWLNDYALKEQARAAVQAPPAPVAAAAPTSTSYKKSNGELEVSQRGGKLDFKINTSVGQHTCELAGVAEMESPTRAVSRQPAPSQCVVKFGLIGDSAEVITSECFDFCGMQAGGSMDGVYRQ